ncbi:hypothetical protein MSG28_011645 [Choristoneura fumiferana]|uniref:Uncharacterized protein n=1 Tax=Choristoneura fumiferana TaxID=7141 RepID=A0ACC0KLE8_CHOFU|nr:hypothetical protein MSG28_011645 [Choristoneura fumiferana]
MDAQKTRKRDQRWESNPGPQQSVLRAITPTPPLDRNLDTNCLNGNEIPIRVLLLHGVPEADTEDATATVIRICRDKLGVQDISDGSLYSCYRLGRTRQGKKQRPFLVRFACQRFRNAVWASKKHLKGSGYTLSEFLTSARHAVFVEARRIFAWRGAGQATANHGAGQDKTRYRITSLDELRAIPQTRLRGRVNGKRSRGRSPMRWTDQIKALTNTPLNTCGREATARENWRRISTCYVTTTALPRVSDQRRRRILTK